jgi:hypothetical protein
MGWTKREYIDAAFTEIGLANYTFDMAPEQYTAALRRLDTMMAEWNARGIRIGYPLPLSPSQSDLDEQTGVPDGANEAIVTNLAIRIAPSYGKNVMPQTMTSARSAWNAIYARTAKSPQMQYSSALPAGAGNKLWNQFYSPFVSPPVDPLLAGDDAAIDYE